MEDLHSLSVGTFTAMLRALSAWLEKGAKHASEKPFDPAVLVGGRLAPDMYPLSKQVQLACVHAAGAVARLTGGEEPSFDDELETMDDLQARIAETIELLRGTPAGALAGAEERRIVIPLPGGGGRIEMTGAQHVRDWALPHFYFHLVTAYDILRHLGTPLGKYDYLPHVAGYIRRSGGRDGAGGGGARKSAGGARRSAPARKRRRPR